MKAYTHRGKFFRTNLTSNPDARSVHFTKQAVVVQPVSGNVALVLGADKPRPFTGADFGWLEAVSDRLSGLLIEKTIMETQG